MNYPIIIFGAGPLGRLAKEIFEQQDRIVYGFLDENEAIKDKMVDDVAVLDNVDSSEFIPLIGKRCDAFIALDDNRLRENIAKKLWLDNHIRPLNAIHKAALISPNASVGYGNFIDANTQVSAGATMGNHCIVHAQSVLGVSAQIADYVQIGAGSVLGHDVIIEKNAFLGNGVNIPAGIRIEEGARIGAGSVVMGSVAKHDTLVGNPARAIDLSKKKPL